MIKQEKIMLIDWDIGYTRSLIEPFLGNKHIEDLFVGIDRSEELEPLLMKNLEAAKLLPTNPKRAISLKCFEVWCDLLSEECPAFTPS